MGLPGFLKPTPMDTNMDTAQSEQAAEIPAAVKAKRTRRTKAEMQAAAPAEAVAGSAAIVMTFDQVKELMALAAGGQQSTEDLAAEVAKAHRKLDKPENSQHPGISAYSYPEGDLARPRQEMRCLTFWCGTKVEGDVDTAQEMELINQLQPGEYICSKSDGSTMPVTVSADVHPVTRKFTRVKVEFTPTRDGMMPRVFMLREMIEQHNARQLVTA